MLRYNAVWRGNRMSGPPPYRLVLPENRSERLQEGLAQVPEQHWANWREVHTRKASDWSTLAAPSALPPDWLATLNGRDPDTTISSGTALLLPGNEQPIERKTDVLSTLRSHVVKSGDTLGAIARRYGVKLGQLLRWNATTAAATLRPGDRILLTPSRNP